MGTVKKLGVHIVRGPAGRGAPEGAASILRGKILNRGGFTPPRLSLILRAPGRLRRLGNSGSDEADDKLLLS